MRPPSSTSTYATGHTNPCVAAVIAYLDDWLYAIEDGSYRYRMPDPGYARPDGAAMWSEEDLARIVEALDYEVETEARGVVGRVAGATCGPRYARLPLPQRLALVQGLERIIRGPGHAGEEGFAALFVNTAGHPLYIHEKPAWLVRKGQERLTDAAAPSVEDPPPGDLA